MSTARIEKISENPTLNLFWRTVQACNIDMDTALGMLEEIGERNNFDVQHLTDASDIYGKGIVPLSDNDKIFIQQLAVERKLKEFARYTNLSTKTLRRILLKGYAIQETYTRFENAKRMWWKKIDNKQREEIIERRGIGMVKRKRDIMAQKGYQMVI